MDRRLIPGTWVKAKASHVTDRAECARRFGPSGASKELYGIVLEVVRIPNLKSGRAATAITAEYDLFGGDKKTKTIGIRCVIDATDDPNRPGYHLPSPDTTNVNNNQLVTGEANNNNSNSNFVDISNLVPNDPNYSTIVNAATAAANAAINETINSPNIRINQTINSPNIRNNQQESTPNRPVTRLFTSPSRQNIVSTNHGTDWYHEPLVTLHEINGPFPYREWGIRSPATNDLLQSRTNSDERLSRLDVFLLMLPPAQLELIVYCTNKLLKDKNKRETTKGEILRLIGVIILMTKVEFKSRGGLWSTEAPSKYESPPNFGKTRISKNRFDELWSCLRFAYQPKERSDNMTSERYQWLLVDNFVDNFNDHRARNFIPSDLICIDESISHWYGQEGEWINCRLPHYVHIKRKPKSGCEIQNAACGRSGIMIRIKLVKTATESKSIEDERLAQLFQSMQLNNQLQEQEQIQQQHQQLLHGIKVMKELLEPWNFTHRLVCADSYYASVAAAEELIRYQFRFIGVVKTATKRFPMKHLSDRIMPHRGDRYALVRKTADGIPDMMSFVWVDRDRRYFVATAGSMQEGDAYFRQRWRQVNKQDANADPERVDIEVPIPKAAELYYKVCGKIDQHNRDRQDTLGIERKIRTNDWSMRVNLSILGMIIVDTWKAYSQLTFGTGHDEHEETQKEFYGHLSAELIDNTYDCIGRRRSRSPDQVTTPTGAAVCHLTGNSRVGEGPHLTPTRRKRKDKDGNETNQKFQGHCRVCKQKTTYVCSVCKDDPNIFDEGWICYPTATVDKDCFPIHLQQKHKDDL